MKPTDFETHPEGETHPLGTGQELARLNDLVRDLERLLEKKNIKPCIYVASSSAWLQEGGAEETKAIVEKLGLIPVALYRLD